MADTRFLELALLCEALGKTKKRNEIAARLGEFLKKRPPAEVPAAVNLILGRAFSKKPLGLSGAAIAGILPELVSGSDREFEGFFAEAPDFGEAIRRLMEKKGFVPAGPKLTIGGVARAFEEIAAVTGAGSRDKKRELLLGLLRAASPLEAKYLVKNVAGEMRHGVDEGLVQAALAKAFSSDSGAIRRATMLTGDVGEAARMAAAGPVEGLKKVGISVFRPVKPMLAKTAESVAEAWEAMPGPLALEYKLDGARVQIHARNGAIRIFSRNLADITEGFPEIVEQVRPALKKGEAIIEGEVIAVKPGGRPLPFQALSRRLGRVRDIEKLRREIPVRLFLFDVLFRDGTLFIDKPNAERWRALAGMSLPAVPRIVPKGEKEGEAFFQKAVREGYEGVVAKSLSGLYSPGTRGSAWYKVKKVRSLDLVITAAEWGYGRRHGWLSNYVLSARDEETGEYLPVGKTFKGLTDLEFQAMTERLLHLRTGESRWSVSVKPEVVVEVLFSDVQKSPRYESGYALRFARIARVRDDKPPAEIDSLATIGALFKSQ